MTKSDGTIQIVPGHNIEFYKDSNTYVFSYKLKDGKEVILTVDGTNTDIFLLDELEKDIVNAFIKAVFDHVGK